MHSYNNFVLIMCLNSFKHLHTLLINAFSYCISEKCEQCQKYAKIAACKSQLPEILSLKMIMKQISVEKHTAKQSRKSTIHPNRQLLPIDKITQQEIIPQPSTLAVKGQSWKGWDPVTVYIPTAKDNLDWLLTMDMEFQAVLTAAVVTPPYIF